MALDLTPEQKVIGKANFHRAVGQLAEADRPGGMTRRRFMQGLIAGAATAPVAAAAYFAYSNERFAEQPVKAGLIGAGDEGGVLVGEHNPRYLKFVAYSDIRPSNRVRIFAGEKDDRGNFRSPRRGLNYHYGENCQRSIRQYDNYRQLLDDREVEVVVIALPLHLHAPVAIEAMQAGKHVLCEKLMAWNIRQCKQMIRVADQTDRLLAIGHQRHYSMLYAHALEVFNSGVLGEVRHIRALWHRNNARPVMENGREVLDPETRTTRYNDGWRPAIKPEDREALEHNIRAHGYVDMNELVRWRLYNRTGAGLMAELGSHQLDACSIFLSRGDREHPVHPIAVSAVGGTYFYRDGRQVDDHVFCTYEFPGPQYHPQQHPNDKIIVTYSSINTNGFEPYGECVMGSKGTLIVESEQNAMLYGTAGRSTEVSVTTTGGGRPVLDSSASGPAERSAAAVGQAALGVGEISRGYREEMEHFAYCVRMHGQAGNDPQERLRWRRALRCDGRRALGDAIMALTANQAMREQRRIPFQPSWYDPSTDDVPDANQIARDANGDEVVLG
jgi:predicted dehydrogenase